MVYMNLGIFLLFFKSLHQLELINDERATAACWVIVWTAYFQTAVRGKVSIVSTIDTVSFL